MKVSWKEIILKAKEVADNRWVRMSFWAVLYILWVIWLGNYWWLFGLVVVFDACVTKKVKWAFWKKTYKEGEKHSVWNDWLDAIIFAVIVVTFINIFFFQAFVIPSPSMEGTLLTGDHLFVSKLAYGPKVPQTPLTVPFTHNTIFGGESYSTLIQNEYRRMAGFGKVERDDIVVFNFPNGDTVLTREPAWDYHQIVRELGSREAAIRQFGPIVVRPMDKKDHYVKRCVALPGDTLEVRHGLVYIDGKRAESGKDRRFSFGAPKGGKRDTLLYRSPLDGNADSRNLFPYYSVESGWTRDFYGPLWVPTKGATVSLDARSLPIYERIIRDYEHNTLTVAEDGTILVNGIASTTYTFKQDYYFMMGDNRHNSLDSRYWGFVPEDHIVGKPFMIWLSTDPEKGSFPFNIRWNRFFKFL